MRQIATDAAPHAPAAVDRFSQAIESNGLLFVSGQVPVDPKTNVPVDGDVREQAEVALDNLEAVLDEAGLDFTDLVKVTVLFTETEYYDPIHDVYNDRIDEPYPAKSAIHVPEFPIDVDVEFEAIAER